MCTKYQKSDCCVEQFPAADCAAHCITAHQSRSQSTTCTFYVRHLTQPHYRQQFSTSNILYTAIFYHLTGILTKTIRFLTVGWSRRIILYYIILYYNTLYYIILYYIILYCIILHYITLYYIILYYIILLFFSPWSWQHDRPKHVDGHFVVKLHS